MGVREVVKSIKSMKTRGATKTAIVGLKTLRDVAEKRGFGKEFNQAAKKLESARPTAVVMHNVIKQVKGEKTLEAIDKMVYYLANIDDIIAFKNHKIVEKGSTILTHCHSAAVVSLLSYARKKKIKFKVVVTETRPRYQGKITAKELEHAGIDVTYIIDAAAGEFINKIDAMVVGCDSIRKEGIVNKIGTYPLAVLAHEKKVPVYFVGGTIKLDIRKKFKIEERPEGEVLVRGLPGVEMDVKNPAFDITPWKYVTAVLTEKGSLKPDKIRRMLK